MGFIKGFNWAVPPKALLDCLGSQAFEQVSDILILQGKAQLAVGVLGDRVCTWEHGSITPPLKELLSQR